jgi:hypothetical protein
MRGYAFGSLYYILSDQMAFSLPTVLVVFKSIIHFVIAFLSSLEDNHAAINTSWRGVLETLVDLR